MNSIKNKIETDFEDGGYKLKNAHFENGRNLHSEQYYFAKRYFQNTDNCIELAEILRSKLIELKSKELSFAEPTTLIGFRNYTSLLLDIVKESTNNEYNYAIIEQKSSDDFIWQHLPPLKENLVIILPVTCTCSAYIKLQKFLKQDKGRDINKNFINLFLILEESLKNRELDTIKIDELKESDNESDINLYKMYSAFDWTAIDKDKIVFNNRSPKQSHDKRSEDFYFARPLIRLYSKMYLPESCPLCFPKDGNSSNEKPIFPTHDNYETPNLIFGFPNFSKAENRQNVFETFASNDIKTHLSGHINIDGDSYSSYIIGNAFYKKNKDNILEFFDRELSNRLTRKDEKIIFITAENKHNSNFLEDISLKDSLKDRSVTILRFQPSNEFVDNFISLHSKDIKEKTVKVIYFEDVISAGKTFKLISNYIKHARNENPQNINPKIINRHGFDLLLTLVDRMPPYTKDEIIRKIFSDTNIVPEEKFVAFFRLNVPIIAAAHLGNPLQREIENLEKMIDQCHLDSLKMTIGKEIDKQKPKSLPELDIVNQDDKILKYFPFGNIEREMDEELYKLYKDHFNKENLDLLKLYLAHTINSELAETKYQNPDFFKKYENKPGRFIKRLINKIGALIKDDIENYLFLDKNNNLDKRNREVEREIVHDTVVKILSHPPFIYYKNINEPIFYYCITELDKLYKRIETNGLRAFDDFRKLKFYLRRSIDLNSNFIISERFFECIKKQYNKKRFGEVTDFHNKSLDDLEERRVKGEINYNYFRAASNNAEYKLEQVSAFFSYLLYYYKELVFKNPSISIKLEEALNSETLLPKEISNPDAPGNKLEELISDRYFHFTGMIKAENISLLNDLKEYHKRNVVKQLIKELKSGNYENKTDVPRSLSVFDYNLRKKEIICSSIFDYYFKKKKNDPVILNAQKLIENSRHNKGREYYKKRLENDTKSYQKMKFDNKKAGIKISEEIYQKRLEDDKQRRLELKEKNEANYRDVKTAIVNMLWTVSMLESKKMNPKSSDKPETTNLNTEIKDILNSVIDIIAPDVSMNKFRNKLKYAFFLEYRKKTKDIIESENIYSLVSNETPDNPSAIKLNKNGLIYNMLYGLYDDRVSERKQTLIAAVKLGKDVKSFKDKYYIPTENKPQEISFAELYENDVYNNQSGQGIQLLDKAQMSLVFRFSNLLKNENYALEGRAVLLITNTQEAIIDNFLDFMSNEKIRLILLIKEELLDYLQKQFDNDAFFDVIENRKKVIYQKHLRHGIGNYLAAQSLLWKDISKNGSTPESHKLFQLVTEAIRGQLTATKIENVLEKDKVTKESFVEKLRLIFESDILGRRKINFSEIDLSELNFEEIELHPSVFNAVIPELVINMKKYCPMIGETGLAIKYDSTTNYFYFKNIINKKINHADYAGGEGLVMCDDILKALNLDPFERDDRNPDEFLIILKV